MAEAEDVITDAAQHATSLVLDYWKRRTYRETPYDQTLRAHKKRLEILLRSMFGQTLSIRIAQPPARPTVLTKLFTRRPKRLFQLRALPAQDGRCLFLPPVLPLVLPLPRTPAPLPVSAGESPALRLYRVMALQQAQRCLRRRHLQQPDLSPADPLVLPQEPLPYSLYQLSEAASADHDLVQRYPGLQNDLQNMRRYALSQRPPLHKLQGLEQDLEALYQRLLAFDCRELPEPFVHCSTAAASLDWAHARARQLTGSSQRFWGLELDEWIGLSLEPETEIVSEMMQPEQSPAPEKPKQTQLQRRPQVREREEDEEDPNSGFWMVQPSIPMEHAEDPMGMQRPADREEDADAGGLAESLEEMEETAVVSTPEPAKEVLASEEAPSRALPPDQERGLSPTAITYPEWDYRISVYREQGALVRLCEPVPGSADWVSAVMHKHRRQLQEIRRRFEAMRTRRQVQRRQLDGSELDMGEFVAAWADRIAGLPLSERLFQAERILRRDCAVLLLIDISGSTDAWVSDQQRILDVAKESLVLVTSALDALGDPYAIQAFSGEGPQQVRVTELKSFQSTSQHQLNQRIAALEPDRFTRVGAALRHATATLAKTAAQRRLLVLLSDGKPNDTDLYEGRYGVEDTRQAVQEAVLQGIHPFCITVDREAPEYMPYIFGPQRFAVLRQVQGLPIILLDLLRHFLRA